MNTLQISDAFDPYYVGRKGILTPIRVSEDEARHKPDQRAQNDKSPAIAPTAEKPG